MKDLSVQSLVDNYRSLLAEHSDGAAVAQCSREGQIARFERLAEIDNLDGCSVIDLGCNLGALHHYLRERFRNVSYTGIDIVPELIDKAVRLNEGAEFICRDVIADGFGVSADYVLMSGIFNNDMASADEFMHEILLRSFSACEKGLGFNFISTHVNFVDAGLQYFDPAVVYDFCLHNLSRKVVMSHHYFRCDVSVFVYK